MTEDQSNMKDFPYLRKTSIDEDGVIYFRPNKKAEQSQRKSQRLFDKINLDFHKEA